MPANFTTSVVASWMANAVVEIVSTVASSRASPTASTIRTALYTLDSVRAHTETDMVSVMAAILSCANGDRLAPVLE